MRRIKALASEDFDVSAYGGFDKADMNYDHIIVGDVAVIPVYGELVMRADFMSEIIFGLTSYERIESMLTLALSDDRVSSILFRIGSTGGTTNGLSNLSRLIFDSRGVKPIEAYVDSYAASAAYYIASSASKITLSSLSGVGGLGTIVDISMGDNDTITIVSKNAPLKDLDVSTEEGMNAIKDRINYMEDVFIADVSRNRGVSTSFVLENYGKGDIIIGEMAVSAGVADEVSTYNEVLDRMQGSGAKTNNSGRVEREEGISMSTGDGALDVPAKHDAEASNVITADSVKASNPDVYAAIAKSAMDRVGGIIGSESAKGKLKLANELAYSTDLTVSAACKLLDAATAETSAFESRMSADGNFDVGANGDGETGEPDLTAQMQELAKSQGLA